MGKRVQKRTIGDFFHALIRPITEADAWFSDPNRPSQPLTGRTSGNAERIFAVAPFDSPIACRGATLRPSPRQKPNENHHYENVHCDAVDCAGLHAGRWPAK